MSSGDWEVDFPRFPCTIPNNARLLIIQFGIHGTVSKGQLLSNSGSKQEIYIPK